MKNVVITLFSLFLISCCIFRTGYINEFDQYVPKKDKFKLRNKIDFIFPPSLDTNNIYLLRNIFYSGKQEYPFVFNDYRFGDVRFEIGKVYKKFYSNGRSLNFAIPKYDKFGSLNKLSNKDLYPNNPNYSKGYYFSSGGNFINEEVFVYAEGDGRYSYNDYKVSDLGNTLTLDFEGTKKVYVKETIPIDWIHYPADW